MPPPARQLAARPAWQVAGLGAGIVVGTLLTIVLLVAVAAATAPVSPLAGRLHQAVVGLPVVLAVYEAARRLLFRRPAAWFLAGRPDRRLLGWIAVGLGFPATVLGLELWLLGATLTAQPPPLGTAVAYAVASLAAGLLAGVLEELALRGALLRVLEARWGSRIAVAVTAVVFAALHQGHAAGTAGLALVVSAMLAAGLFLGVVVVRTRNVWHAVAVHAGWNTVFGGRLVAAAPQGSAIDAAVLQFRLQADATLLNGGDLSLGGAPLTTAALLLATMAVAVAPGRWLIGDRTTGSSRAGVGR